VVEQRVLVVDDDPWLREMLHTVLTEEGYAARAAPDGRQALAQAQTWRPDLILLDLMMPDMNGWAFRHAQLADPSLASIPVVLVSAAYTLEREGEKLGVAAVVPKPYDLDALLAVLGRLLGVAG
jgi:two-component system response regulator MprA